jgi:non-heme chloroperoxidase
MPYIKTTDGTTLYYKDWGTGKPMVFIHPWAMSSAVWEYNMFYFLEQGYRCIAFDRRGHGRSDDPGKGYDMDTLSQDIEEVLAALDLHDIILVAHSLGGAEALRYVSRYRDQGRVEKLVVISAPDYLAKAANNPDGIDAELVELGVKQIAHDYALWIDDNTDPFFLADTFGVTQGIIQWSKDMMLETTLLAAIECRRTVCYTDLRPDIRRINVPTLVIHGDHDASIPFQCGQRIAQTLPGCVFKPYPGAPHGLIISNAEKLQKDILSFIQN